MIRSLPGLLSSSPTTVSKVSFAPVSRIEGKSLEFEPPLDDKLELGALPVATSTTVVQEKPVEEHRPAYQAPEGLQGPLISIETPSVGESGAGNFVLAGVLKSASEAELGPLLQALGVKPNQSIGERFDPTLKGQEAQDQLVSWQAGQVADLLRNGRQDLARQLLDGQHLELAGKSILASLQKSTTAPESSQVFQDTLKAGQMPENTLVLDTEDIHFVDTYTTRLAEEKGFTGLPTVVEPGTLSLLQASGEISEMVYRGQPKAFNDDLLSNPDHKFRLSSGRSTYGPAIYVSTSEQEASTYIGSERDDRVSMLRMGLKKGARLETWDNLDKMMEADRAALRQQSQSRVQELQARITTADPDTAARLKSEMETEQANLLLKETMMFGSPESLNRDYSRYAIYKGYDAVICGEYATLAVLNRSALVIERPA